MKQAQAQQPQLKPAEGTLSRYDKMDEYVLIHTGTNKTYIY